MPGKRSKKLWSQLASQRNGFVEVVSKVFTPNLGEIVTGGGFSTSRNEEISPFTLLISWFIRVVGSNIFHFHPDP